MNAVKAAAVGAATLGLLAAGGCSTGASGHPAAPSTPSSVTLHGFVTWTDSMPYQPIDPTATSTDPLSLETPYPYDSSTAQQRCSSDLIEPQVVRWQIVILGSAGETLAAATPDASLMYNGQSATQAQPNLDFGADFTCAMAWTAPPVPAQAAYTLKFGAGGSKVVNGSQANQAIYLGAGSD